VLARDPDCIVTLMERTPLPEPLRVDGTVALEDGSPVLWFTFPGRWHDIGLFHTADGTFTGTYANILTPVRFLDSRSWETTDLFLDVWLDRAGRPVLLDEDEFEQAVRASVIDGATAVQARSEAERIMRAIGDCAWPPNPVPQWSLDRALGVIGTDRTALRPAPRGTSEPAERA
jgi:predicted RNA-binding protein associated with RNAse of E/G family